jgi:hypothetical protein
MAAARSSSKGSINKRNGIVDDTNINNNNISNNNSHGYVVTGEGSSSLAAELSNFLVAARPAITSIGDILPLPHPPLHHNHTYLTPRTTLPIDAAIRASPSARSSLSALIATNMNNNGSPSLTLSGLRRATDNVNDPLLQTVIDGVRAIVGPSPSSSSSSSSSSTKMNGATMNGSINVTTPARSSSSSALSSPPSKQSIPVAATPSSMVAVAIAAGTPTSSLAKLTSPPVTIVVPPKATPPVTESETPKAEKKKRGKKATTATTEPTTVVTTPVCKKCRKTGDDNELAVCSVCQGRYHAACIPLKKLPKSAKWTCKECKTANTKAKTKPSTTTPNDVPALETITPHTTTEGDEVVAAWAAPGEETHAAHISGLSQDNTTDGGKKGKKRKVTSSKGEEKSTTKNIKDEPVRASSPAPTSTTSKRAKTEMASPRKRGNTKLKIEDEPFEPKDEHDGTSDDKKTTSRQGSRRATNVNHTKEEFLKISYGGMNLM